MLLKGMLKWAIAKEDRRDWRISQSCSSNSTTTTSSSNNSSPNNFTSAKSLLRKRPKLSHSNLPLFQNDPAGEKNNATSAPLSTAIPPPLGTGIKTTELISAKAHSQPLKQHHQQEQKGQQKPEQFENNGSPMDDGGINIINSGSQRFGPTHCRQPDNNNTCCSNDHWGKRPAGHNDRNNDSHNCIINSSTTTATTTSDPILNCTSADSKSLLYMSLDHLPLAIVKQYERMLKEQEGIVEDNNNNNNNNKELNEHHDRHHQRLPHAQHNPPPPPPDGPKKVQPQQKGSRKSHHKKCLSFSASTLPYKFKSKLGNTQKKIILPLHGQTVVTTSAVGSTRKSLNHVSKLVRSGKTSSSTTSSKISMTDPPGRTCRQDIRKEASSTSVTTTTTTTTTKGHQTTAVVATTTTLATATITSCSPSPLSISSGTPAGSSLPLGTTTTEMIRHARSRPLKTSSSFRSVLNDNDDDHNNNRNKINCRRVISPPTYRRQISHGQGGSSASMSIIENNNPSSSIPKQMSNNNTNNNNSHKSGQLYGLPSSSPPPYKSSTLPRAARNNQSKNSTNSISTSTTTDSNNFKSILKTTSSSQTQTYKSILKNSRELNNNNLSITNHNNATTTTSSSTTNIENLNTTPLRRPFQSLLNVSTECNPPTPESTGEKKKTNRRIKMDRNSSTTSDTSSNSDEDGDEEEDKTPDKNRNEKKLETKTVIRRIRNEEGDDSARVEDDHDTTDPQFLEKSLTFSFPAVTKCAKKLSLKRSELKKLERIRSQTDKLNRFLRKYYHECLPNLPEEEESQCSPEEKSLSLILRRQWREENFPNLDSTRSRARTNSNYFNNNSNSNNKDNNDADSQLTNLFNNATTSSSSMSTSSSCSSSSCSSSSSSSDLDCWPGYSNSSSSRHSSGPSHRISKSHHHHHHRRRESHHNHQGRKCRQKCHCRNMLSSNETSLLPIIQEDSAEVSSASVKSLESCRKVRSNNSAGEQEETATIVLSGLDHHHQSHQNNCYETIKEDPASAQLRLNNNNKNNLEEGNLSSSMPVKHDNMEQVEDHMEEIYSVRRNVFVTEGAETDFCKLKGSLMFHGKEKPFDVPTMLPFADDEDAELEESEEVEEEENLVLEGTPQQRFTPPHPSPPSSTGSSSLLLPENTDNHSLASSGSNASSHGYGSGSGTTIRTPEDHHHHHTPVHDEDDDVDDAIITDLPVHTLKQQERQEGEHGKENEYENGAELYGKKNDDGPHNDDEDVEEEDDDDDGNSSRATISSTMTTNANYPSETENETWNSHEYPSGSPYGSFVDEEDEVEQDARTTNIAQNYTPFESPQQQQQLFLSRLHHLYDHDTADFDKPLQSPAPLIVKVHRKEKPSPAGPNNSNINNSSSISMDITKEKSRNEDESLKGHGPSCFNTPIKRLMKSSPMKKATPRKLVRKPPVKSIFSGKGEVLIRTYTNGDYVTLHVVHAKNLQPSYRSSWKLAIKISLLPDAEATFTKLESVEVNRNRSWVKIDQKFSFEVSNPEKLADQKVFLTFWKRIDRKTLFLGWTTLSPSTLSPESTSSNNSNNNCKTTQCWLKLRKRKMNGTSVSQAASYTPAAYSTTTSIHGGGGGATPSSKSSPLPLEIETLEEVQTPDTQDEDNNHYDHHTHHHHHPSDGVKSHFPNSATMDSGVEDCCEPAVIQPSIELDETQGRRVTVKMKKEENQGFGFSVVWVSPPRVERLEKDKVADLAGLKIGDLIIGVNGEDVITVPNTTIYHSMKTTGNELGLEVWRKNPPAPTPATVVKSNDTHIGSMVMMLMTGTGTPRMSATSPSAAVAAAANESHQNAVNNSNSTVHCPKHGPQPHQQHQHHHHHHHHSHASSTSVNTAGSRPSAPSSHPVGESASNINSNNQHHYHHQSHHQHLPTQQQQQPQQQQDGGRGAQLNNNPSGNVCSVHNIPSTAVNIKSNNPPIKVQLPPVSILKPPPPAPPAGQQPSSSPLVSSHNHHHHTQAQQRNPGLATKLPTQPTLNSSSWKIRFNVELLDNEEDSLKQFFICELKFFRKVVAALDRYLIPAQANKLLTPQEIHSIFAHIIHIITMTKRILQCVASGSPKSGWRLGEILFSTHSDHLSEIKNGYTTYAQNLGNSALILGEKMTINSFARFVLETPVPKGHLDITSLLFAPLEHLRNLCEICDEIANQFDRWTDFSAQLKECYANIVVHTDYMEPISHISMKKHPLLSVRDLEKRIVSTTCQPLKVNEKGRKWLFGSRLFRKETDGSWAPVWAFLFSDIIVLTSHMTRDRVFFVKEAPIRLEDVVTLHFNLPRKNENEFRLVFGPEPSQTHYGRFDRILPIYRRPKCNQICLRTSNLQLKSLWKLLLQRQIITLNTRLSKSSSSNFSISEFCEKFPVSESQAARHEEKIDEEPEDEENSSGEGSGETMGKNQQSSSSLSKVVAVQKESRKVHDNEPPNKSSGLPVVLPNPKKTTLATAVNEQTLMGGTQSAGTSNVESTVPKSSSSITSIIKESGSRIIQVPDHKTQLTVEGSSVIASTTNSSLREDIKKSSTSAVCSTTTSQPSRTELIPKQSDNTHHNLVQITSTSPHKVSATGSKSSSSPSSTNNTAPVPNLSHTSSQTRTYISTTFASPVPLTLDLTVKPNETQQEGSSSATTVKSLETSLSSVVSPSDTISQSRKSSTGKFTQKPIQMLASPSEGSPSKSYLNSRKSSAAKVEAVVNNNNDSIHDMNHIRDRYRAIKDEHCGYESQQQHGKTEKGPGSPKNSPPSKDSQKSMNDSARNLEHSDSNNSRHKNTISTTGSTEKSQQQRVSTIPAQYSSNYSPTTEQLPNAIDNKISVSNSTANNTSGKSYVNDDVKNKVGHGGTRGNEPSQHEVATTNNTNNASESHQQSSSEDVRGNHIKLGGGAVGLDRSRIETVRGKTTRGDLPGPKIMTNAILKSRQQQEQLSATCPNPPTSAIENDKDSGMSHKDGDSSSKPGSYVTMASKDTLIPPNGISQTSNTGAKRHVVAPSERELERNPAQNVSNSCSMGKVYANSPIVSGIGSQRTRRRLLYDYKVRRDYPELFGITPRDRRSFIKKLGDLEASEEKTLVAPYYYHTTLSPLPRPKNGAATAVATTYTQQQQARDKSGLALVTNTLLKTPCNKNGLLNNMKIMSSLEDDEDDASTSTGSITHTSAKMLDKDGNNAYHRLKRLEDEDDSDGSTTGHNNNNDTCMSSINERSHEIQLPPHDPSRNRRSPEESSSNDSGISEEILLTTDGHPKNPSSSNTEGSDDMPLSNNSSMTSEIDPAVKSGRFPSSLREHEVNCSTTTTLNRCAVSNTAPTTFVPAQVNNLNNATTNNNSNSIISKSHAPPSTCKEQNVKVRNNENTSSLYTPSSSSSTTDKSSGSTISALAQDPHAKVQLLSSVKHDVDDGHDIHTVDGHVVDDDGCCPKNNSSNTHHDDSTTTATTTTTTTRTAQLSSHSKMMNHVCFVEGATTDGMETVVELASSSTATAEPAVPTTKVDKSTGTEDDDYCLDLSWIGANQHTQELAYRRLLAEKREAFFSSPTTSITDSPPHYLDHSQQHPSSSTSPYYRLNSDSPTLRTTYSQSSYSSSYYSTHPPVIPNGIPDPLKVKIYDGDTVQSTAPPPKPPSDHGACERVMYTRLEKEKTALVERVESSDDSTSSSSDVASASPAAENGTTDPSWSSSSSSLAGYSSSIKEEPSPSTSAAAAAAVAYSSTSTNAGRPHSLQRQRSLPSTSTTGYASTSSACTTGTNTNDLLPSSSSSSVMNGHKNMLVSSFLDTRNRPAIVVTEDSPENPKNGYGDNSDDEEDEEQGTSSIISNGRSRSSGKNEFLRVGSNDSTAENYGDDDDYNFDDEDDEDLSHCSVATMNRYGTFESLEKLEGDDGLGTLPDFRNNMPRSKARFTFDDDDDDDEDLFEEDFESDFNFRFPGQIQDNTYSVSRLGPLPPLLEEDYEDDMYEDNRASSESPNNSAEGRSPGSSHIQVHQTGVRGDNSFLLARIATMYARSSISPLRIFRELLLKKRYRQWGYKE